MKRAVTFLVLWLATAVLLAGMCIRVMPPGGVSWPYYLFVLCLPAGALLDARYSGRLMLVACYGLIGGAWFALPMFDDPRGVMVGVTSVEAIAMKVVAFALAMSGICCGSFTFGKKVFRKNEFQTG